MGQVKSISIFPTMGLETEDDINGRLVRLLPFSKSLFFFWYQKPVGDGIIPLITSTFVFFLKYIVHNVPIFGNVAKYLSNLFQSY
jgi:hypothetical protein